MRGQIIEKKKLDKKNSVWLIRVQTRDSKGELKSRSVTVRGTKTDAEKTRTKLLSEKDTKGVIASPKQNLNQFLDLWLSVIKPKLHSRTWQDYKELLQRYVRETLGTIKLENLKVMHLQKLYGDMQERGLSPRVVRYTNSTLRSALNYAVKMDLVIRNETAFCELPRLIPREMTIFTQEEVRLFLNAAKVERIFALFSFLLGTGCRPEEALGLKWTDVNFEKSLVVIRRVVVWQRSGGGWEFCEPKTKKSSRTIPLPLSLTQELKRHRIRQHAERLKLGIAWKDFDLVFPSEVGTPLTMSRVTRVFKRIKSNAKLIKPIRLYDLRHTVATLLLQANVNPKIVSERLGHSTITQTLDTYTAVLPHLQEQASEHLEDMIFSKTGG